MELLYYDSHAENSNCTLWLTLMTSYSIVLLIGTKKTNNFTANCHQLLRKCNAVTMSYCMAQVANPRFITCSRFTLPADVISNSRPTHLTNNEFAIVQVNSSYIMNRSLIKLRRDVIISQDNYRGI
jgi:hypothetical protein